jgi:hypothetical protein
MQKRLPVQPTVWLISSQTVRRGAVSHTSTESSFERSTPVQIACAEGPVRTRSPDGNCYTRERSSDNDISAEVFRLRARHCTHRITSLAPSTRMKILCKESAAQPSNDHASPSEATCKACARDQSPPSTLRGLPPRERAGQVVQAMNYADAGSFLVVSRRRTKKAADPLVS